MKTRVTLSVLKKTFFPVSIFCLSVLMVCSCSSFRDFSASSDSLSITPCRFPQGQKGAVSLSVIYCSLSSPACEQLSKPFQQAGIRAVFFEDLRTLEAYIPLKKTIYWERFKNYIAAGHLVGIHIRNNDLPGESPDTLSERIDRVVEFVCQKTGYRIPVLRMESSRGTHPLAFDTHLLKKYIIDDHSGYMHTLSGRTPGEVASEAAMGHKWISFYFIQQQAKEYTQQYLSQMVAELKKQKIAVIPYPEMELYRRNLHSAYCTVEKKETANVGLLELKGHSPQYPTTAVDYKISQRCAGKQKESIVSLKNGEVHELPLIGPFKKIKKIPALQYAQLPGDAKAAVVFSFDDTNFDQVKVWYPTIRKYGLVSTHFLNMGSPLLPQLLPYLKEMEKNGFEIGCHSYCHFTKDKPIALMPDKIFRDDLNKAVKVIRESGLHCTAYCFPANAHSFSSREAVREFFPYQVWNERESFYPESMQFNAVEYADLLLNYNYDHIQMIHTPIYCKQNYLAAFEPLFAILAKDKRFLNWTFSQMQAYHTARTKAEIVYYSSDENKICFSIVNKTGGTIPCLRPLTCKLKDSGAIEKILGDGTEIKWQQKNGCILFDAALGQRMGICFKK